MRKILLACCACLSFGSVASTDTGHLNDARETPRETHWIAQAANGLDPRVLETLPRLRGIARQLLALRAYLCAGDSLPARWSWTQQQLASYPASDEGRAAAADIDAVEQVFARANPGFTARANRMPRSLDIQVDRWNGNPEVGMVARQLQVALEHEFPADAAAPDIERVRQALTSWQPTSAAPLAAPGLSAHGRGRAFDFLIEHDNHVVADFDAAATHRTWDAQGWTSKLHAAVLASGKSFVGPLQSPYEPWHYAYIPKSASGSL